MVGFLCFFLMLPKTGFSVYGRLFNSIPIKSTYTRYGIVSAIEFFGAIFFILFLVHNSDMRILDKPSIILFISAIFSPAAACALIYFERQSLIPLAGIVEKYNLTEGRVLKFEKIDRPSLTLKIDSVLIIFVAIVFLALIFDRKEIDHTYRLDGDVILWSATFLAVTYYAYISGHAYVAFGRLFLFIETIFLRHSYDILNRNLISVLHRSIWTAFLCYCAGLFMLPILIYSPNTSAPGLQVRQVIVYIFAVYFFIFFIILFWRVDQLATLEFSIRKQNCWKPISGLKQAASEEKIDAILNFLRLDGKYKTINIAGIIQLFLTLALPIIIERAMSFSYTLNQ